MYNCCCSLVQSCLVETIDDKLRVRDPESLISLSQSLSLACLSPSPSSLRRTAERGLVKKATQSVLLNCPIPSPVTARPRLSTDSTELERRIFSLIFRSLGFNSPSFHDFYVRRPLDSFDPFPPGVRRRDLWRIEKKSSRRAKIRQSRLVKTRRRDKKSADDKTNTTRAGFDCLDRQQWVLVCEWVRDCVGPTW